MENPNQTPAGDPTPQLSPEEVAHNEKIAEHAASKTPDELPSGKEGDETPAPDMFNGMSDEWKEQNLKDGKLFGKFDSVDAMAKSYQKLNDERAQNGQQAKDAEAQQTAANAKAEASNTVLTDIASNGFNISEDNFKAMEDAGVSRIETENMAYKMERAANQAYATAGGKEQYDSLVSWGNENLTQSEKDMFMSKTVGDNFSLKDTSTMAIEWLQMKMANAPAQKQDNSRINGQTTPNQTIQGYASKKEYNEDYNYIRNNPKDTNAQRMYEKKMSMTNMNNLR